MNITDAGRREALLKVYELEFAEMQEFRSTAMNLALAYNSAILSVLAWSFTKSVSLAALPMAFLTIGVASLTWAPIVRYLRLLRRYFLDVAGVVNRIDRAYGMHESDAFLAGESIFPKEWKEFGGEAWKEPVFQAAIWASTLIPAFALVATWVLFLNPGR